MILDDFPYLTVTATCSGEPTGCCYGFNTGELTYGETFQPNIYAGGEEEHVTRSYISPDVKDGCYRTVTLEAVTRSGEHPGLTLEGLYLSEGRTQGFVAGEAVSSTPALSVGRFFYIGNIGGVSETVLSENNLILSASAADYTITVTLTKESTASSVEQQVPEVEEKQEGEAELTTVQEARESLGDVSTSTALADAEREEDTEETTLEKREETGEEVPATGAQVDVEEQESDDGTESEDEVVVAESANSDKQLTREVSEGPLGA